MSNDIKLLRLTEVTEMVGLSRSTLYRMIAAGTFPAPVSVSARSVRFRSDLVLSWINSRPMVGEAT